MTHQITGWGEPNLELVKQSRSVLDTLIDHAIYQQTLEQEKTTGLVLNNCGNIVPIHIKAGSGVSMATFTQDEFVVCGTAREFAESYFIYYLMNKSNLNLKQVWAQEPESVKAELEHLYRKQIGEKTRLFFKMRFLRNSNSYVILSCGPQKYFQDAATYAFQHRMVSPFLARKVFNMSGGFVEKEQPYTLEDLLKYLQKPEVRVELVCAQNIGVILPNHEALKKILLRINPNCLDDTFKAPQQEKVMGMANKHQSIHNLGYRFFTQNEAKSESEFKPKRSKIIMFNAPPRAGKDEACKIIKETYPDVISVNFKDVLYQQSAEHLGLAEDFWTAICQNGDLKDRPMLKDEANGCYLTPRQVLIHYAEKIMKPAKGQDCISVETAKNIKEKVSKLDRPFVVVMPDLGFDYEQSVMQEQFPDADVITVRVERPNCTYEGDSRKYMDQYDHKLVNDGSLEVYAGKVMELFDLIMQEETHVDRS